MGLSRGSAVSVSRAGIRWEKNGFAELHVSQHHEAPVGVRAYLVCGNRKKIVGQRVALVEHRLASVIDDGTAERVHPDAPEPYLRGVLRQGTEAVNVNLTYPVF